MKRIHLCLCTTKARARIRGSLTPSPAASTGAPGLGPQPALSASGLGTGTWGQGTALSPSRLLSSQNGGSGAADASHRRRGPAGGRETAAALPAAEMGAPPHGTAQSRMRRGRRTGASRGFYSSLSHPSAVGGDRAGKAQGPPFPVPLLHPRAFRLVLPDPPPHPSSLPRSSHRRTPSAAPSPAPPRPEQPARRGAAGAHLQCCKPPRPAS